MGHHSQTKHLNLVQTQMLRPTLGMVTMVTGPTGVVTTATDMATMVTMERDLLRPSQVLKLLPVLKPRPTPGMATTDTATMATDLMAMAITTERDLPMPSPLPMLLRAPKPRPILGMATMDMGTDLTGMATTATDLMVMLTGDKSESQEQHPLFPADSSVKHQFLQNNFIFTL